MISIPSTGRSSPGYICDSAIALLESKARFLLALVRLVSSVSRGNSDCVQDGAPPRQRSIKYNRSALFIMSNDLGYLFDRLML